MTRVDQHLTEPPAEFVALRDECDRLGYLNGVDYFLWHVPASLSSELVELGVEDGTYRVWYRDLGRRRELAATADFGEARRVFLDEVARLAGPRGRGPYAGQEAPPSHYEDMSPQDVYEQLRRDGYFT